MAKKEKAVFGSIGLLVAGGLALLVYLGLKKKGNLLPDRAAPPVEKTTAMNPPRLSIRFIEAGNWYPNSMIQGISSANRVSNNETWRLADVRDGLASAVIDVSTQSSGTQDEKIAGAIRLTLFDEQSSWLADKTTDAVLLSWTTVRLNVSEMLLATIPGKRYAFAIELFESGVMADRDDFFFIVM